MSFLVRVDRWITNTVAYLTPSGPWEFLEEHQLFRDFVYLDTFRQQLRDFLNSYALPLYLCDQDDRWYAFLEAYSGVIEDGTLSTRSEKYNALGAVKEVMFTKGPSLTTDHHVPFVIEWNIRLKDGRTVRTNVRTVPEGAGNMTLHRLDFINGTFVPPPQ